MHIFQPSFDHCTGCVRRCHTGICSHLPRKYYILYLIYGNVDADKGIVRIAANTARQNRQLRDKRHTPICLMPQSGRVAYTLLSGGTGR